MWKGNRPENWDAHQIVHELSKDAYAYMSDYIEAGADVILSALKSEGLEIRAALLDAEAYRQKKRIMDYIVDSLIKNNAQEGTLMFAPKEG